MEDIAAARPLCLDDLTLRARAQSVKEAPRVSPDAVRLTRRAAIEGDPHEGGSSHLANPHVGWHLFAICATCEHWRVRAHRRLAWRGLVGIAGALAIAAGIAVPPSGGKTAAGNKAQAQRSASQVLALMKLPPNATQSNTEPGGDNGVLAAPTDNEATPNLVDAYAWWRVPGKAGDVLAYVAGHLPHGAKRFMTSSGNVAPGYAAEAWTLGPIPNVLTERVFGVTVVQLTPGTTGVRTDGEALWIVPRPPWEVVPAGVRTVVIRAFSSHVPNGRRLLPNGVYTLTGAGAHRLVAFINGMPLVQPGLRHCPAGFLASVHLRFLSDPGHTLATAVEHPTGCASVTLALRGRRGPPLEDYPSVTSELQRLRRH
jgi:hypothetical protein